jgi:hypothetical protein
MWGHQNPLPAPHAVPPVAILFARREDRACEVGASGARPRAERRSALRVWLRLGRAVIPSSEINYGRQTCNVGNLLRKFWRVECL